MTKPLPGLRVTQDIKGKVVVAGDDHLVPEDGLGVKKLAKIDAIREGSRVGEVTGVDQDISGRELKVSCQSVRVRDANEPANTEKDVI